MKMRQYNHLKAVLFRLSGATKEIGVLISQIHAVIQEIGSKIFSDLEAGFCENLAQKSPNFQRTGHPDPKPLMGFSRIGG